MQFQLQKNFFLGTTSAATQIEGGECETNWMQFYRDGFVSDGSSPAVATEHWKHWKADDELMAKMHLQIARIGIEWARIFPNENTVDEIALQQYRDEIIFLQKNNIRVLLTLHHFSNPLWFEKKGGWLKIENIEFFLNFVKVVVEKLSDIVSEFITINEPNVYATNSFFFGEWYPCHKSFAETFCVMENMANAHILAYKLIHDERKKFENEKNKTFVGFANHLRVFAPKQKWNPFHMLSSKASEYFFQTAISRAFAFGVFLPPLKNKANLTKGLYTDFHGINYYTRSTVSGLENGVKKNSPRNDLGWEIYPHGIIECAEKMFRFAKLPIWITENGTCDKNDSFRCRYIFEHLKEIAESTLPIERYYHWCFIDNWEWKEGCAARFGLVHNDFEKQKRTVKKSGEFFSRIIQEHGVSEKLFTEFVKDEKFFISKT